MVFNCVIKVELGVQFPRPLCKPLAVPDILVLIESYIISFYYELLWYMYLLYKIYLIYQININEGSCEISRRVLEWGFWVPLTRRGNFDVFDIELNIALIELNIALIDTEGTIQK